MTQLNNGNLKQLNANGPACGSDFKYVSASSLICSQRGSVELELELELELDPDPELEPGLELESTESLVESVGPTLPLPEDPSELTAERASST